MNSLNNEPLTVHFFIESLVQQTISAIETLANHYIQQILHEKEKLLSKLKTTKNPDAINAIVNAIVNHQINMNQYAQYNIKQRIKAFCHNQS